MLRYKTKFYSKLEALRERRPPWPRQIITVILPTVKMLSLGCERLPTPLKKKKKKKKKKRTKKDKLTNATKNITSFAKEVIMQISL